MPLYLVLNDEDCITNVVYAENEEIATEENIGFNMGACTHLVELDSMSQKQIHELENQHSNKLSKRFCCHTDCAANKNMACTDKRKKNFENPEQSCLLFRKRKR